MLHLPGGVGVTRLGPEPLHPSVAYTVQEDNETFNKLGTGDVLPASDGDSVPCPTELGERTQKAGEGDESVTPEDPTLNEMGEADIDVISPASTGVYDHTGKQLHETDKDQNPFQRGENSGTGLPVPGLLVVHLRNWIVQGVIRTNGMVTSVKSAGNSGSV